MSYRLLFGLLFSKVDEERAHSFASFALNVLTRAPVLGPLIRRVLAPRDPRLRVRAMGLSFPSPLGAAAGMDKGATWFDALRSIGFGYVEIGTITARAQEGTPARRVWRLTGDRALINAMGFPNPGTAAAAERLRRRSDHTIVGANIGRSLHPVGSTASDDYCASVRELAPVSDYVALNVSSPNTPGLRDLQAEGVLRGLISDVRDELHRLDRDLPLLVKISPDLSDEEVDAIADLALELRLDGIIAVNTTVERAGLHSAEPSGTEGRGGVSGAPLKARSVAVLSRLRSRVGDRVTLISVGGIEDANDAWQRILAGASLLQSYTGFVYGGPLWPSKINRGLLRRLDLAGAASLQDMIGAGAPAEPNGSSVEFRDVTPPAPRPPTRARPAWQPEATPAPQSASVAEHGRPRPQSTENDGAGAQVVAESAPSCWR